MAEWGRRRDEKKPARKIDSEKYLISFNSITSQFLGFFHWMVFDFFVVVA